MIMSRKLLSVLLCAGIALTACSSNKSQTGSSLEQLKKKGRS